MSRRVVVQKLDRVTQAIGYVCIYWAWLEDCIAELILDLAPFDSKQLKKTEIQQIRDVIFIDTDIRTKIKILRAIAFIRKWDESWYAQVDKTLNKIDNVIRPQRNRVVHGLWFIPKGRLERHRKLAVVKKPQSFAKDELATREHVPVKMRELWRLGGSIIAAEIRLVQLFMRHDVVQKLINGKIEQAEANWWTDNVLDAIRQHPELLPALLAKPIPQDARSKSSDIRPKNIRPKQRRQPRSSSH